MPDEVLLLLLLLFLLNCVADWLMDLMALDQRRVTRLPSRLRGEGVGRMKYTGRERELDPWWVEAVVAFAVWVWAGS